MSNHAARPQSDTLKSIVFAVWLPGTQPETHASFLTLANTNALRFFLEGLARGHSMFFGQEFCLVALLRNQEQGRGRYTVRYALSAQHDVQGIELIVHDDQGVLHHFLEVSWYEMMQSLLNQTRNLTLEDLQ